MNRKKAFLLGCKAGFPIAFGYFSISITFGVLAVQSGLHSLEATAMSIFVFAGASQFIAISLVASAGWLEIILATFILNLRHLLMSTTIARSIKTTRLKAAILSFGLTDETFVVATIGKEKEKIEESYFLGIALTAYLSWVLGTFIGGSFGDFIPASLTNSMGIALYAMFIALLTPAIKQSLQKALVAASSAILCTLIYYLLNDTISYGWAVVISTIFGASIGLFFPNENYTVEGDVV